MKASKEARLVVYNFYSNVYYQYTRIMLDEALRSSTNNT